MNSSTLFQIATYSFIDHFMPPPFASCFIIDQALNLAAIVLVLLHWSVSGELCGLVTNYPVIIAITAVITLILVFWVRKCQMGSSVVITLCLPSASYICGNYRQGFISSLLSDERMPYDTYQYKQNGHTPHHTPHIIYNKKYVHTPWSCVTTGGVEVSSPPVTVRTLFLLLLPCSLIQLLIAPCFW